MWSLLRGGLVVFAAALSLCACSGGGEDEPGASTAPATTSTAGSVVATPASSTATATATPGASATATTTAGAAETNDVDGVKAFARAIDEALGRGDVGAVTSRVRGTPEVAFSHWKAAQSTLPADRARTELTQLLTRTQASDRDSYGTAAPKVWWVGYDMSRPNLVVTDISLDEATGYRRLGVLLQLRYCDSGCAAEDRGRWVIGGVVLNWGDQFLALSDEFAAAFGRPGERYRRPLVLTPEIREAAQAVAQAMGNAALAIPDCRADAGCITTADPGVAVDLGVMRLGFQAPAGQGGSAAIVAGRMADKSWRFWFGTQQGSYRMLDLPGDVIVCANGDGLNVRERPDSGAPSVGFLRDLAKVYAEEFVLTTPGSFEPGGNVGSGWYRVSRGGLAQPGWVSSRFVADARLGNCELHDAIERP